jgi:hypothetical protein
MTSRPIGYLPCPECGEDAVQSSAAGCLVCGTDHDEDSGAERCRGKVEPLWTEDDGGPCPGCGIDLRIVVEDGRAWAREVEA